MNIQDCSKKLNTIDGVDLSYHSIIDKIYPKKFVKGASIYEKYKMNEFKKLNNDLCDNQRTQLLNGKKLKFITTNSEDLLDGRRDLNFFGMTAHDQSFIPSDTIDTYSNLLNGRDGGILTNERYKFSLGELPLPTAPYRGQLHHGNVVIEDNMRNYVNIKKNACLPRDHNFELRSFAIFDNKKGIETPNALDSVQRPSNGFILGQNGIPTRFLDRFNHPQPTEDSDDLSHVTGYNSNNY